MSLRVDNTQPPAGREPSAERPLLLLDVDGVLCPIGRRHPEPLVDVPGTYARYGASTPARLARLAEAFRLVWATSWESEANEILAPAFGLPPLPVVRFDDEAGPGEDWKLPAIRRFVRHRPFAWVDDAIGYDAHAWARERHQNTPTLLLDIAPDRGLDEQHTERLLRFALDLHAPTRARARTPTPSDTKSRSHHPETGL